MMKNIKLMYDDVAISPIIGIILMVDLIIALASTVYAYINIRTPELGPIYTEIYDQWDENDFTPSSQTKTTHQYPVEMTREWDGADLICAIKMSGINRHWSTGVQLMIADGKNPLYTLGWSPRSSTTSPTYKPFESGSWGVATITLPLGMKLSDNYDEEYYEMTIPAYYLGGAGAKFYWEMNVEVSFAGPDSSRNYIQNFPVSWERWYDGVNCYIDQIGAELILPWSIK